MGKEQALIKNFEILKNSYTWRRDASFGENDDSVLWTIARDIICPMLSISFETGCQMWEYELNRYSNPNVGSGVDYSVFSEDIFEYGDFDIFVRVFSQNEKLVDYIFKNNRYVSYHSEEFIAKLIYSNRFDLADKLLKKMLNNSIGQKDPQTILYETLHRSLIGQEARWKLNSDGIDFIAKWVELTSSELKKAQLQTELLSIVDCVEGDAPRGALPFSMINEENVLERLAADKAKRGSSSNHSNDDYNAIMQERAEQRTSKNAQKKSDISTVIKKIDEEALLASIKKLNALIGLAGVKAEITSLCNLMRVRLLREARNFKVAETSQHLVFVGNPGTGKTTVARLVGEIYHALGFLSKGQFIEVDRSGLVAGYVGQTALKTQKVIQSALGGVLFIDEAYSLAPKYQEDFGSEAIDTLIKAMEDNRDDFVVIVAGYHELMDNFIRSNPGLQSRFNKYIHFSDYNGNELLEIFLRLLEKNNYTVTNEVREVLSSFFTRLYEERDENFGNAREVRNVFETIIVNQANRLASAESLSDKEIMEITIADLQGIIAIN